MVNLIQRLAPLAAVGLILAGCSTFPNYIPIELGTKDGYFAESSLVQDELDLITSFRVGEVTLQKVGNDYLWKKTGKYLQSAQLWNSVFADVCRSADKKGNRHITNNEAQDLLNLYYRAATEAVPTQDHSDVYDKA